MSNDGPVLVVGGTGLLGGKVITALQGKGKRVRALVRPSSEATGLMDSRVEVVRGDMMDPESLLRAMEGADAVITTAAGYTRPGAFLDQVARGGGDPFAKRRLTWLGSDQVPMTFVLTSDLTEYLDIGWDRPVSMHQIADIAGRLLGERITVRAVPAGVLHGAGKVLGPAVPFVRDMGAMFDWFQTGKYVADTARQGEVFGPPPTAEDAVARFLAQLGHTVRQ